MSFFLFGDQNYFSWQELGLTKAAFWYITGLTVSSKYLLIRSVINFSYLTRRPGYFLPNNLLRKHVFGFRCWECRDRSCPWFQEAHRQTSSDQNVLQVEVCVWGVKGGYDGIKGGGVLGKDKETQKSFQEIWGLSCCYWNIIASMCKGMEAWSIRVPSHLLFLELLLKSSALDFQGHPLRSGQKQAVKSQPFPLVSGLWEHSDTPHGNCGFIKIKADWWAQALCSVFSLLVLLVPLWPCFLMEMHFSLSPLPRYRCSRIWKAFYLKIFVL